MAASRDRSARYQAAYRAANKKKIAKRKAAYRAAHRKPKVLKNEKGKPEASIRQAKPVAGIATLDAVLKPI